MFVTEHEFELPKGYVDSQGNLHRQGTMRLATAADEILPMKDPRVQGLPAYLIVIILSRVVIKLGKVPQVHCGVIEGLLPAKTTASGRVTEELRAIRRAFPILVRVWQDSRMTLDEPGIRHQRRSLRRCLGETRTAPTPRPQRGQPHVDGPLGGLPNTTASG